MTGNRGIRFITAVNSADRETLINGQLIESCAGLEGYKLTEYGTLMGFESRESLYIGNGAQSYAYRPGDDRIFSRQGADIWFTGMLVGNELELPENAKLELLMRPYFILEGPDGEQIPIYGGQFQRSLGYVALQNRDYTGGGQAAYDFIWKIIRNAYGEDYQYAG